MKGLRARATAAFRGFNLLGAAPKPRSGAAMPEERIARSPTKPRLSLPSVPVVPRKSLPALQGTARAHWGGAGRGCGFRVDGGGSPPVVLGPAPGSFWSAPLPSGQVSVLWILCTCLLSFEARPRCRIRDAQSTSIRS